MELVAAAEIDARLSFPSLVAALREAFREPGVAPLRHHHAIGTGAAQATHLVMPAWSGEAPGPGTFLGTKIVNVFPGNGSKGLPTVFGTYILMSGETGAPLAAIDGARLTQWRTAAASALAASFLARRDAERLLILGAGALAPFLVRAHVSQRPIRSVAVWNHRHERARNLADRLGAEGFTANAVLDLEAAVRQADIVSCATLSQVPLVRGIWLSAGCHLDLVGAFDRSMREADDVALQRASLFVDTPAALSEGGDVALALTAGAIEPPHVLGTLFDLCAGRRIGRRSVDEITAFKSVGTALEDLAAAMLVWRRS